MMGVALTVLVIGVGQSFTNVPIIFAQPTYKAEFTDSGGVKKGDKVRIAGLDVGKVEGVGIQGDRVAVTFTVGPNAVGTESRLSIRTDTILGRKILVLEPRGNKALHPGGTLPLGQNTTPYQIYDAFFDVTTAATGWNIDSVKESLHVLSETIDQTSPHLSAALDGVAKFSDTIGKRDEDVKHLLAQANQVAGVLGDRSEQVDRLLVNAKTLLVAFNERGRAIDALLANIASFSQQVKGLINDNPELNDVLQQLGKVTDILEKRKSELAAGLTAVGAFLPSLNESIASGPYFKVVLHNIAPGWIMQPFIDAAFKKRGLSPEDFWRSAGLPAYRFPDPNGTRFPNGAPPPPPQVLEGTPDHPGPAVPPGAPCSYAPAADGIPSPANPLPCAGASGGPFGGAVFPAPIDVVTSAPNPAAGFEAHGIPIAGRPGEPAPAAPGIPVPLPADAPPGARREPLGPAGPVAPPSTFAPGLPPGPIAPPGPGALLPAPFINVGGVGGSGLMGGSQN